MKHTPKDILSAVALIEGCDTFNEGTEILIDFLSQKFAAAYIEAGNDQRTLVILESLWWRLTQMGEPPHPSLDIKP